MGEPDVASLRRQLVAWYRARKRDLPFRRTRDPYAILVAEIILQRTRVRAGLPYYERFLAAFPTVRDLAAASERDVLRVWEGLGFYGRARNLHRAARAMTERHGGTVPESFGALRSLPGIGDYTAGAVGSIAFGLRVPAVDGNASRVLSRVYRIEDDVSRGPGKRRVRDLAAWLVPADAPGEWNQALMELGATVCTPRAPKCGVCPIAGECVAFAAGVQEALPRTAAKAKTRVVPVVFVVAIHDGSVLLLPRGDGLHAGLYGLPGGEVRLREDPEAAARRVLGDIGLRFAALEPLGPVRQTFSHLRWEGTAYRCQARGRAPSAQWIPIGSLECLPLIPLHRRLLSRAVAGDRAL